MARPPLDQSSVPARVAWHVARITNVRCCSLTLQLLRLLRFLVHACMFDHQWLYFSFMLPLFKRTCSNVYQEHRCTSCLCLRVWRWKSTAGILRARYSYLQRTNNLTESCLSSLRTRNHEKSCDCRSLVVKHAQNSLKFAAAARHTMGISSLQSWDITQKERSVWGRYSRCNTKISRYLVKKVT